MYDINPSELVQRVAQELKKVEGLKPPDWAPFVKTGMFKERPPVKKDWWYERSAAVLRKVAKLGPVGVSKLRTQFGGRKNRGVAPEHFYKGSGSILRTILQDLEKAGLVKSGGKESKKGRVLTQKGAKVLGQAHAQLAKEKGIKFEKTVVEEKPVAEKKPRAPRKTVVKKDAGAVQPVQTPAQTTPTQQPTQ